MIQKYCIVSDKLFRNKWATDDWNIPPSEMCLSCWSFESTLRCLLESTSDGPKAVRAKAGESPSSLSLSCACGIWNPSLEIKGAFHSTKIPVWNFGNSTSQVKQCIPIVLTRPTATTSLVIVLESRMQMRGTGDNNYVKWKGPSALPKWADRSEWWPSKVVPNIPVGPNRNGPFHLVCNRNFRNFGWMKSERPLV